MRVSYLTKGKGKALRIISAFLAINILAQVVSPTAAWALTTGPSQPEVQSFEPIGTSDMVDLFTGDFNYNIPLFELPGPNGGYPFNIAYHSGIGMDQEASWVGLGWNLNPGAVTREMRGMPDDFKGDVIKKTMDMKDHHSFGVGFSASSEDLEILGADMTKAVAFASITLGMKAYYNNFKGIGYSLEPGIDFAFDKSDMGLGLNLSLDSQEGVGGNIGLTYKDDQHINNTKYSLGLGFNSKRGIDISLSASSIEENTKIRSNGKWVATQPSKNRNSANGASSYSFSEKAYTPMISNPTISSNLGVTFKAGITMGGVFPNQKFQGFYSIEHLHNKGQEEDYYGYGYNYLQHLGTDEKKRISDFNREKDGVIRKESPNLAIPNVTYDYYNIAGQGIGGMFRPYRSEVGHIEDPLVRSWGAGGTFGFELGVTPPNSHFGGAFHLNFSTSSSQAWDNANNRWQDFYKFTGKEDISNLDYEDVYYKVRGEYTSYDVDEKDYIGGDEAVRAAFTKEGTFLGWKYNPKDDELYTSSHAFKPTGGVKDRRAKGRMSRNTSVQPITNDLLMSGSTTLLPEYKVDYYTGINDFATTSPYSRASNQAHHNAGITVLNPDGNRYVYALPAYNNYKVETIFTCGELTGGTECGPLYPLSTINPSSTFYQLPNTDEYFSRTETGPYAHSYMLTSILGTDYVDVTGNGVSEDDYGYWVKFNYVKANDFNWRAPYTDANYDRGYISSAADNKASFNYGTREVWHLASAESKTHIAVFQISERRDGRDANDEYNMASTAIGSGKAYKLDRIDLYSRMEYGNGTPVPIKSVHFDYTYDLCGQVKNNEPGTAGVSPITNVDRNANTGKLTLKKIWFTYQNNERGELSPYKFDYKERLAGNIDATHNPNYGLTNYDRWGNYKPSGTYCNDIHSPYVKQFDPSVLQDPANKSAFRALADQYASVWSLKEISLPTGGTLKIDYEADDYEYVQHKKAGQMFQILKFDNATSNHIYDNGTWDKNHTTNAQQRRIYFKLETPVDASLTATKQAEVLKDQYLSGLKQDDGTYQLYYKIKVKLRKPTEGVQDFVSGYATIDPDINTCGIVDGDATSEVTVGSVTCNTIGYFTVMPNDLNNNTKKYHPFSVAAWQHIRTNQPDLMMATGSIQAETSGSAVAKALKAKSLGSIIPAVQQMFSGYRDYAYNRNWGSEVDLANSFIRLSTPDGVKIGGGARVKKITIEDNWADATTNESSSKYGQVYDYTTEVTDPVLLTPKKISTGVAQYEPMIGGDEISLRFAKNYPQKIPVFTNNSLFFEYPVNESYFPGPVVGYSKVTVKSLATYNQSLDNTDPDKLADGVATTGAAIHEFYTAREFPVLWDETDIEKEPYNLYIPIPLIGQIVTHNMTASQGYSLELNDMHGKLKGVSYYAQDINGDLEPTAISSMRYNYKYKTKQLKDGTEVFRLDNTVDVISGEQLNSQGNQFECNVSQAIMGEEYEFFTDQRKTRSISLNGGLDWNLEQLGPIPLPCPWPTFGSATYDTRTAVTNKIIHKTGVLISTEATDGQSKVETHNKLFDSQTGRPILTTVTNNFNNPVYNYEYPAMWAYEGMGAAYKNWGMYFHAEIVGFDGTNNTFSITSPTKNISYTTSPFPIVFNTLYDALQEGDEFIIDKINGSDDHKATLIRRVSTCTPNGTTYELLFHINDGPSTMSNGNEYRFDLTRSGKRNQLTAAAGNIIALKDPTDNANRSYLTLPTVYYNASTQGPAIVAEMAAFLNGILDCNGQFPLRTYDLSSNECYGADGEHKLPLLASLFSTLTIGICNEGACGTGTSEGYHLTYTRKDDCTQQGTCHCIARRYADDGSIAVITEISSSSSAVNITYSKAPGTTQWSAACFELAVNPKITCIKDVINASAMLYRDYWDYDKLARSCNVGNTQIDLYALGKKGIWRPFTDHYYKDARYKEPAVNTTDPGLKLSHDGVFGTSADFCFYRFNWKPTAGFPVPPQWIQKGLITKYNENGIEVENKDITGVYSSALYGYEGNLSVAVASNAKQSEIFYESADDASTLAVSTGTTDLTFAHTGKNSIKVITSPNTLTINSLRPVSGKRYAVSLWAGRQNSLLPNYYNATSANCVAVEVKCYNSSNSQVGSTVTISASQSGKLIEGWQRIEGEFTPGNGVVKVVLTFLNGGTTTNFDDIRIFPYEGNIKTYVFDEITYRLSAILDDNNYATIYNYDEQGNLFLVKKETANGIKTIQESRSHQKE